MIEINNSKALEKELQKKIESYERKISWHLLLVFIVSGVLTYQVIYNVIFSSVIYNPALGDTPVKGLETDTILDEYKVTVWKEESNMVTRSIDDVPCAFGIPSPQFFLVCVLTALGLAMFNIRAYLLKRYIQITKDELQDK